MVSGSSRSARRSCLPTTRAALLWLALVLSVALAQTIALRHGYSHTTAEAASSAAGKHSGGLAQCHACVVAASLGGGALPAGPLLCPEAAQQLPDFATRIAHHAGPQFRPYAIRAPPGLAS